MNFNVGFHFFIHFHETSLEYIPEAIDRSYQMCTDKYELWNRHPDLTLLAII